MAEEKRLIDANALYTKLVKMAREPYYQHNGDDYYVGISDASMEVHCAPTVDAVEVVHGTWENEQIGFMYYDATCSVCKSHNNSASNYCPHCGAKMDGVSDG